MPIPSQLNVDIINPETGTNVVVSGVTIDDSNQAIKIGFQAGLSLGIGSTAVGRYTLNASTGQGNTGIGFQAARLQTTGFGNTSVGAYSMNDFVTGSSNTALGYYALRNATSSDNSTGVGAQSLVNLTDGIQNTALGQDSGRNITTGDNNICVGFNAQATSATVSNEITLGNAVNSILRCAVTSITSLSDARDKKEVTELSAGLDFVNTLKPVEFVWDDRNEEGKHDVKDFGFIAQDLKQSQEDIELADTLKLVYEENPEKLEASYGKLIPILVKAIQELSAKVEQLEK
jgi:hypothetical protein